MRGCLLFFALRGLASTICMYAMTNAAENGFIRQSTMPDGSKIQFRDWATGSEGFNTEATIEFIGGNYTEHIQKIKFND